MAAVRPACATGRSASVAVDVRLGRLEQAERAESIDLGLRVLIGGRQACVSTSDTRPAMLAILAERAVAMAREAPEDPYAGLADPGDLSSRRDADGLELADAAPEPAPEALLDDARAAGAARVRPRSRAVRAPPQV